MPVDYSLAGERARVSIDRPAKRNALTRETTRELETSLRRAEREARVVVLTGNGDAFCAGIDLAATDLSSESSIEDVEAALADFQSVVRAIRELSVPVISRVDGPAHGAGCDIALSADFRIASESAAFSESFVRVGVVSGDGGAFVLPRLVGEARAKELLLLGREVSGSEAHEMGLVNEAVPEPDLAEVVHDYAQRLASLPPTALEKNKRLVNESVSPTLDDAFAEAVTAFRECLLTGDFDEARRAFLEGDDPEFST